MDRGFTKEAGLRLLFPGGEFFAKSSVAEFLLANSKALFLQSQSLVPDKPAAASDHSQSLLGVYIRPKTVFEGFLN